MDSRSQILILDPKLRSWILKIDSRSQTQIRPGKDPRDGFQIPKDGSWTLEMDPRPQTQILDPKDGSCIPNPDQTQEGSQRWIPDPKSRSWILKMDPGSQTLILDPKDGPWILKMDSRSQIQILDPKARFWIPDPESQELDSGPPNPESKAGSWIPKLDPGSQTHTPNPDPGCVQGLNAIPDPKAGSQIRSHPVSVWLFQAGRVQPIRSHSHLLGAFPWIYPMDLPHGFNPSNPPEIPEKEEHCSVI
ncbi:hypothetical protein TURU_037986 [Turdus rufiventris]|nr:hypothetical protein TURU_037986 [Turdus rufiventris]